MLRRGVSFPPVPVSLFDNPSYVPNSQHSVSYEGIRRPYVGTCHAGHHPFHCWSGEKDGGAVCAEFSFFPKDGEQSAQSSLSLS